MFFYNSKKFGGQVASTVRTFRVAKFLVAGNLALAVPVNFARNLMSI